MPTKSNTAQNPTARITSPWRVVKVKPRAGFQLHVEFIDGTAGEVEMGRLIQGSAAGVFSSLRDTRTFMKARVEYGAVTWPGEIDLAPDAMYDAIRANGRWVVE